ncbi:MAG: hypothetical protein J1E36_03810 [Eubacterium sp.]|nr:hypothetical protein [Eubacterium sp.]
MTFNDIWETLKFYFNTIKGLFITIWNMPYMKQIIIIALIGATIFIIGYLIHKNIKRKKIYRR